MNIQIHLQIKQEEKYSRRTRVKVLVLLEQGPEIGRVRLILPFAGVEIALEIHMESFHELRIIRDDMLRIGRNDTRSRSGGEDDGISVALGEVFQDRAVEG
jgi:hypothetical protein